MSILSKRPSIKAWLTFFKRFGQQWISQQQVDIESRSRKQTPINFDSDSKTIFKIWKTQKSNSKRPPNFANNIFLLKSAFSKINLTDRLINEWMVPLVPWDWNTSFGCFRKSKKALKDPLKHKKKSARKSIVFGKVPTAKSISQPNR